MNPNEISRQLQSFKIPTTRNNLFDLGINPAADIEYRRNSSELLSIDKFINKERENSFKANVIKSNNNGLIRNKSNHISSKKLKEINNYLVQQNLTVNNFKDPTIEINELDDIREVFTVNNFKDPTVEIHELDDIRENSYEKIKNVKNTENNHKVYLHTDIITNFEEVDNYENIISEVDNDFKKKINLINSVKKVIKKISKKNLNKETDSNQTNKKNKNLLAEKRLNMPKSNSMCYNDHSNSKHYNKMNLISNSKSKLNKNNSNPNSTANYNQSAEDSFNKKTHHKSSSITIISNRTTVLSLKSTITESSTLEKGNNTLKVKFQKNEIENKNKFPTKNNDLKDKNKSKINENKNKKLDLIPSNIKNKKTMINSVKSPSNTNTCIDDKNFNSSSIINSPTKKPSNTNMNYSTMTYSSNTKLNTAKKQTSTNGNNNISLNTKKIEGKLTGKISGRNSNNKNINSPIKRKNNPKSINSSFSFTDRSFNKRHSKSKNNYSKVNSFLVDTSKTSRNKEASKDTCLVKFNTLKQFSKASSMPKNIAFYEIKECKSEFTGNVDKIKPKNNKIDLEKFLLREVEHTEKKKRKLLDIQEYLRRKELEEVQEKPIINKESKKIANKDPSDFYTRINNYSNKVDIKIKEKIEEKQKEELCLIEKFQEKYKGKQVNMKEKYQNLMNWQNKKTDALREKHKLDFETINRTCTFHPEIDKNSKKITNEKRSYGLNINSDEDIFSRLYKEDLMKRRHKNEILKNIYTPLFSPMVNNKNDNIYNQLNNSINLNNTTCNTITGFKIVNARYASNRNRSKEDRLNMSNFSNQNNNMRKLKSHKNYNLREYSSSNRNNNVSRNFDNSKVNVSYHSDANPDVKSYYDKSLTEAQDNLKDISSNLKEKFKNIFKKYNMN